MWLDLRKLLKGIRFLLQKGFRRAANIKQKRPMMSVSRAFSTGCALISRCSELLLTIWFEWLFSRELVSHRRGPHVSPGTSSKWWLRRDMSFLTVNMRTCKCFLICWCLASPIRPTSYCSSCMFIVHVCSCNTCTEGSHVSTGCALISRCSK